MQVRLLGPFELIEQDGPLRLPGRAERALLAFLALSPGRVVADSPLIEQLWSESEVPVDPANALQSRVSKLRRALTAAGHPKVISRVGGGYRLDIDPMSVDAHRFASTIDAARRAHDPDQAIELYGRALRLWRGEPLVDFTGDAWAGIEATRLADLRLAALADRADRMLSLGRFEDVVADLEPVVARAPTRERLVGQLMTALFNAGRQADALECFGRTRQVLADELGVDPSPDLRHLMQLILRQDASLKAKSRTEESVSLAAAPGVAATVPPAVTPPEPGPAERAGATAAADPGAVPTPNGNLPLRLPSFVGREGDLDRVLAMLNRSRLVTLAGPGGAGKTTLAIEAARRAASGFRDGVRLVRLSAVSGADMLVPAAADGLGLNVDSGNVSRGATDVLVGQLTQRQLLIVLDNCEHLIEPVAALAEATLQRCPSVRILATSREALAVPGEVQLQVHPLPVPPPGTPAAHVEEYAAARLFLDRAQAASPDLLPDDPVREAVAVICRRLDGIPLALELAAARLTGLHPSELAERVTDRFAVLTAGSRTAEARQRTLRQTVDWSHDLLTAAEQVLFRRLSVFRGGWTLPAAEAVVHDARVPGHQVLDLLERLVRQSMVIAEHTAEQITGSTRYRMLETLRQYASEKLTASGEDRAMAAAHSDYFLAWGEQAEAGLRGSTQTQWLARLRADHANLRAALSWMLTADDRAAQAQRLAGSLGLYWHLGRHLEGREMLRQVLDRPGGSPESRARALQAVSLVERPRACIVHPNPVCAAAAQESLTVFRETGDRPARLTKSARETLSVPHVGMPA